MYLRDEGGNFSETLLYASESTRHQVTEDLNIREHLCKNTRPPYQRHFSCRGCVQSCLITPQKTQMSMDYCTLISWEMLKRTARCQALISCH